MRKISLIEAAALYELQKKDASGQWLVSWELPQIAQQALENGFDSPNLRRLAAEDNPELVESGKLLEASLRDLNINRLTIFESGKTSARYFAGLILKRELDPIKGAKTIGQISRIVPELSELLDEYTGLWSVYDDTFDSKTKEWSEAERQKSREQYLKRIFEKSEEIVRL